MIVIFMSNNDIVENIPGIYVEIMSNLNLSKPEMMDGNVSKNIRLEEFLD